LQSTFNGSENSFIQEFLLQKTSVRDGRPERLFFMKIKKAANTYALTANKPQKTK